MKKYNLAALLISGLILVACGSDPADDANNNGDSDTLCEPSNIMPQAGTMVELGREIFMDVNLSTPAGQSCADCHDPAAGFADPVGAAANEPKNIPVSEGANQGKFGNRNAPTAAYASFAPEFAFIDDGIVEPHYVGGQFLDGRRADLVAQAQDPFLNPLEMANPDKAAVVNKVCVASYAGMFIDRFGANAFDDIDTAYTNIAVAIAEFEKSPEVNPFTSKFDYYLKGQATLTPAEERGRLLFEDPEFEDKAKCKNCHTIDPEPLTGKILFTNFTYSNIGVPKNPLNPFYQQPANPDGNNFIDLGLGGVLAERGEANAASENGKFKVPTLRNVELTAPYMHNGVFSTLREVVEFYNDRDVVVTPPKWPPPEVSDNVNDAEMGDLQLTEEEIDDLVAFMKTLTDGFTPP